MAESKTEVPREDPFFIGWLPVPAAYRRFLLPVVAGFLLVAVGGAAAVAYLQRDPGNARWDTKAHTFDGIAFTRPYAMIRVPGDPPRTLLLVEDGKFGALARVEQPRAGKSGRAGRSCNGYAAAAGRPVDPGTGGGRRRCGG
jgi:hypothetical protein